MIILTGANTDVAKYDSGALRKDIRFRFSSVISRTVDKATELGYTADVYDLGTLGMGRPFQVDDKTFLEKGHYGRDIVSGYKSRSLFKPALVKQCLNEHQDFTVYVDGDAELRQSIDEVDSGDYDVGVTLRERIELESDWYDKLVDIVKFVNAGVIFFNPTPATAKFVDEWERLTDEVGNDQMALNKLTCPDTYPDEGSIETINGVRVKYFPCRIYNYYYFGDLFPYEAKIMHFKGIVRHFYPYSWKTRLYSAALVPLKTLKRSIASLRRKSEPFTAK